MRMILVVLATLVLAGCSLPNNSDGPCDRQVDGLEQALEHDVPMVKVYIVDIASDDEMNELIDRADRTKGVDRVDFVSKDEALERARKMFEDDPSILADLPGNPFPASLELTVDPGRADDVAREFEDLRRVDEVKVADNSSRKMLQDYRAGHRQAAICRSLSETPAEHVRRKSATSGQSAFQVEVE